MRVAFVCGSLEPGRDGVGDYSRRLAGECVRLGHSCALVALNDHAVQATQSGSQQIEGFSLPVLRLPAQASWNARMDEARQWLGAFKPAWVSLQFVPYGHHPKGLRFGLGKSLSSLAKNASWHIMFHELWLGLGEGASAKDRVYGALQRRIMLDMAKRLAPRAIHTQAEPYRRILADENISADILPLFCNIPYSEGDGWSGLLEPLISKASGKPAERSSLYLAGILGGVHPEWKAEDAVNLMLPLAQKSNRKLVLVFHGKNNLPPQAFEAMRSRLDGRAEVVVTGERSDVEISRILQSLDMGIATSPRQNIQKSGSALAMLEHGLQVLVTRDDWRLRGHNFQLREISSRLVFPEQFALLETLPVRDTRTPVESGVKKTAAKLLAALGAVSPANEPVPA